MPDPASALHPDLGGRAVVTGASRGIGKALALRLAAEGAEVVVAAKSVQSTDASPAASTTRSSRSTHAAAAPWNVRL